ncbi:PDR/VanB family oxidoreductase [Azospirillum rugosum]|uniref:Vanillate O-demethylase ferredoxin subunit n=1 Tax=Azospirillum rugosum TaxID=416170 RepID=A0ABS4SL22_9PROT|nr:PDR/VanB family oxidoreductase [Azospirillum rugosum]MBP2293266.1 vanillate O-demethylase ferredoxin subunit [Azospirillum rugosum]
MSVLDVLIRRRVIEADGIVMLELVSATGEPLPPFEAGAHIDVHVGPDLIRQYSLCNDPAETQCYRLGVLLDPQSRGGSAAVHATFLEGQSVRIGVPRNNFPLAEGARKSILVAGGIGVTPLLAMAYRLTAAGADFELHYCSRSESRTAFRSLLAEAPFADRVVYHFDDGAPEQRFSPDAVLGSADADTHLYICGPSGFMDYVRNAAEARGWPSANIHLEHFGAAVEVGGDSFQVRAEQSGVTVTVGKDETIAQALDKAGVDILTSCEQGVCGACLTRVLEGEPDHRDAYQTAEEKAANSHVTICCSRSKSPLLVLDV